MIWRRPAFALVSLVVAGCTVPEADVTDRQMHLEQRSQELGTFLASAGPEAQLNRTGLLVQLAFGPEADLDLYVTDPQLETVYFANHRSKSGGQISSDSRCDGDDFRIEEVRFDAPKPGRYRVGIDYPESCAGNEEPTAHAVSVFYNGNRLEAQGSVSLRQFEVIVLEFDIDAMDLKEATK